jgi:hypothetical protein
MRGVSGSCSLASSPKQFSVECVEYADIRCMRGDKRSRGVCHDHLLGMEDDALVN